MFEIISSILAHCCRDSRVGEYLIPQICSDVNVVCIKEPHSVGTDDKICDEKQLPNLNDILKFKKIILKNVFKKSTRPILNLVIYIFFLIKRERETRQHDPSQNGPEVLERGLT
jgi:hypothetical protein